MEFFGITLYGPQNFIKDVLHEEYEEPMTKEDVGPLMRKVEKYSTMPKRIQRPDVNTIRIIDCYLGRVNGFAYGSFQRFVKMKRKGVIKPTGPADIYRLPPATSIELGTKEEKRQVPKMLQRILRYDIQITKGFVDAALKNSGLRSLRNHAKLLELSCHGIVWLAGWLSFIWLFNNKELYQLQVNMLIALILDIVVIAFIKAFVRRRRPVPMNKLLEVGPDKYSFPSGHASRATMIAFIMMYIDPVSIIFYPPLLAWITSVALSRVLLERHYILDVFGGIGIGILEGLFMYLIWFSQSTSSSILTSLSDEKRDGGEYHV